MHNPEEDDIVVTRKSKRQWTTKSFGDDYIMYLVDDIPYLFTCCSIDHNSSITFSRCLSWSYHSLDGCKDSFPKQRVRGGDLHG